MWIVGHFEKDNTVEVVPHTWICKTENGIESFWPSYQNKMKIMEAVRNKASPQCDWKVYKINILGSYDSYGKAHSKCNKAQETDDLSSSAVESGTDELGRGRRNHEKNRNDEYHYEDDYPDDLPSFPHAVVNNSTDVFNKRNFDDVPANNENENLFNTIPKLPTSSSRFKSQSNKDTSVELLQEVVNDCRQLMTKHIEFHKQHIRELHLIKLMVKENRETLDFLLKNATKQGDLDSVPTEVNKAMQLITSSLPVKTEEDLNKLESMINENEFNMQYLVKELSLLGGSTVKELVRRIMYHTFSNDVGALYSYEGQKGKKVFKTLFVQAVILKAVRRQFNDATDLEIIKGIKAWLVAAKFRGKNTHS